MSLSLRTACNPLTLLPANKALFHLKPTDAVAFFSRGPSTAIVTLHAAWVVVNSPPPSGPPTIRPPALRDQTGDEIWAQNARARQHPLDKIFM